MLGLSGMFKPSPAKLWAEAAFAAVTAASREPGLYGPGRTPDTLDGRFEMLILHGTAAFLRLKGDPQAERLGDAFANRFFKGLDEGLRELGVGDMSVPRTMKKMAQSVYGRIQAYETTLHDRTALSGSIARNVFNADEAAFAPALAARLIACVAALRAAPVDAMADPAIWPRDSLA